MTSPPIRKSDCFRESGADSTGAQLLVLGQRPKVSRMTLGVDGSLILIASRAPSAPKVFGTSVACASASAIWWAVSGREVWCEKNRESFSLPGIVAEDSP